jgi:hypothetical protein
VGVQGRRLRLRLRLRLNWRRVRLSLEILRIIVLGLLNGLLNRLLWDWINIIRRLVRRISSGDERCFGGRRVFFRCLL